MNDHWRVVLTFNPPGTEAYESWELSVVATGEVLASGPAPVDEVVVRNACLAHGQRIKAALAETATS